MVLVEGASKRKKSAAGKEAVYYTPKLVQNALTTPMEGEGLLLRVTRLSDRCV